MQLGLKKYLDKLVRIYNLSISSRSTGLEQELKFWDEWFKTKGLAWPEGYLKRFDPDLELSEYHRSFIDHLPQEDITILDVGSGPLTLLGKKHPSKRLTIVATDVLAEKYNVLLRKHQIDPIVRTVFADAEKLTDIYKENTFDFVNAQNAIDHAEKPLHAIRQMLCVVKENCFVGLRHVENEAENANYFGLHKWNFTIQDGRLLLKSRFELVDVAREIASIGEVTCYFEDKWVIARIRKKSAHDRSRSIGIAH
jgi:2-polyprenyl-3-methyl-5-hydroxy-6-metoxy-1,4-benzoquinol methylase